MTLGVDRIAASTVIWAAGVQASSTADWLDAEHDPAGRILVGSDLAIEGHRDIFAIRDVSSCTDVSGKTVPGVAPAAKQQGAFVGRLIRAEVDSGAKRPVFRYSDWGSLATIGRERATVQLGPLRLSGHLAWLLWCVAHVWFLIGFRNRIAVVLDWVWSYFTFERGARLITGGIED